MSESAVFVGRNKQIGQLRCAYAERRDILLIGPSGIGKTALLRQASHFFHLVLCEETSSLGRICENLERQSGWPHRKMNLIERKNRLLAYLIGRAEPVAFDALALTPPRVARFIQKLIERVPVWIACRSSQPKQIGAVWQHLQHFERIDLGPFLPNETADLIRAAVSAGRIATSTANQMRQLHRIAGGNPRAVEELLNELSSRGYRLENAFDRKLLELDRRIHNAAATVAAP